MLRLNEQIEATAVAHYVLSPTHSAFFPFEHYITLLALGRFAKRSGVLSFLGVSNLGERKSG
jgi:hypothetical protein